MFHPKGPNFFLSWSVAWKKQSPNNNFFQALSPLSNKLSFDCHWNFVLIIKWRIPDMSVNVRIIFARTPFGGSLVNLTPFCNILSSQIITARFIFWVDTETGKTSVGIELNKRRKSLLTSKGMPSGVVLTSAASPFTIFSNCGIHDAAKWQFCSKTQSPDLVAREIRSAAIGPCPCPKEIMCSLSARPFSAA